MNSPVSRLFALAFTLGAVGGAFAQGSLIPPGAPAPLFKTLDQVEPRTAITNLPIVITQGASYYLTKSFVENFANDAITIRSNNVTPDLCGFTIQQTVGSNIASGLFVAPFVASTPMKEIVVRNGSITGFTNGPGIECQGPQNCVFENLSVTAWAGGFKLQASGSAGATDNVIRHCRTCDNPGFTGVLILSGAGNLIVGCRASGNTGVNYTIAIGNRMGPIVQPGTNAAPINGSTSTTGAGNTDPFANLS